MTFIEDVSEFFNELFAIEFLGNSGWDYIQAGLTILLSWIIFYAIKSQVLRRISRWASEKEDLENLALLLSRINEVFSLRLIVVLSIYLGIQPLSIEYPAFELILLGVLLVIIGFSVIKLLFAIVDYTVTSPRVVDTVERQNILDFFKLMIKGVIVIVIVLWALQSLGVEVTGLIAGLGVFGLAIAFALQNTIADVFASIIIFFDHPYEEGDVIKVGGDAGKVESIGIRSTRIRVSDGHMLIIPNRELSNARINNITRMERRRIVKTIGIHMSTPYKKLAKVPELIRNVIGQHEGVEVDRVTFKNIGDFSFDFEYVYFVFAGSSLSHLEILDQVNFGIIEALDKEGIEMPFPTQTILLEKE